VPSPAYWDEFPELQPQCELRQRAVTLLDGCSIDIIEAGKVTAPPAILILPPHTPLLLFTPLIELLQEKLRLFTWEHRGSPFHPVSLVDPSSTDLLASDVAAVGRDVAPSGCLAVAACGATILLTLAHAKHGWHPSSAFLVAPSRISDEDDTPPRDDSAELLARVLSGTGDPERARRLFTIMSSTKKTDDPDDILIAQLQALNFRSASSLVRYSALRAALSRPLAEFGALPPAALFARLAADRPVSILQAADDQVVSITSTREAVANTPTPVHLHVEDAGGHYIYFKKPDVVAGRIIQFAAATYTIDYSS